MTGMAKGTFRYPGTYQDARGNWYWKAKRTTGRVDDEGRPFTSTTAAYNARQAFLDGYGQPAPEPVTVVAPAPELSSITFGEWWRQALKRKVNIEPGSMGCYERDCRLRLEPAFGHMPMNDIDYDAISDQVVEWAECGDWMPKTINNTLTSLSVVFNEAIKSRKRTGVSFNPAPLVTRLDVDDTERDFLRPHEVPLYLDACHPVYRPVAETLIGTGARVSELIALLLSPDLDELDAGIIRIARTQKGDGKSAGKTKGKRARDVGIGDGLKAMLQVLRAQRAEFSTDVTTTLLFEQPKRKAKTDKGSWRGGGPMNRNTISMGWHKDALERAGLRDMELHALRHTAAAAWLSAGAGLEFVQRQLGHADYKTTDRIYGHMVKTVKVEKARAAEAWLYDASAAVLR